MTNIHGLNPEHPFPITRTDWTALVAQLLDGDSEKAIKTVHTMLDSGVRSEQIVLDGIEVAMKQLDDKCTVEAFNLLEIMLTGRSVMEVMRVLFPSGQKSAHSKGTIVLASLEGDVHDLGKNIVKTVMMSHGFHVVDCGKDCPLALFRKTVVEEQPIAVGVSGLISTMVPVVRKVRGLFKDDPHIPAECKILAGGAALMQLSAEELNVDFVAQTVFDGLHYLEGLALQKE